MRRARLKVTATVPVRRRLIRDNTTIQPNIPRDDISHDTPPIIARSIPSENIPNIESNSLQFNSTTIRELEIDSQQEPTASIVNLEQETVEMLNNNQGLIANNSITNADAPLNPIRSERVQQNEKHFLPISSSFNLPKTVVRTKRKMMVSESARKLAEARREFQLKHENKPPDRSQLRMYDFIHYNPSTNPMKKKLCDTNAIKATVTTPIETLEEVLGDEDIDDPTCNTVPVPQVKVGPDGQLVIDEQSLVIEHTGVKESRAALASQAVIIDDNDYGNGFYKRRKKTKEWPGWETIKFYKALNTVGTDFLLMQSLFPKRSRQELKIKFKKEERMNRLLVEKALKYSQEFDFDLLKKELESFENPEKLPPESPSKPIDSKKLPKQSRKRKQASRRIAAMSIGEEDACGDLVHDDRNDPAKELEMVNMLVSPTSTIQAVNVNNRHGIQNDSDSEVYNARSTRSGRQPKLRKNHTHTKRSIEEICDNNISSDNDQRMQVESSIDYVEVVAEQISVDRSIFTLEDKSSSSKEINSVEPGSLVIVSKESSDKPGETVVQVYMVSSGANGKMNLTQSSPINDVTAESFTKTVAESDSSATDELLEDLANT